MSADSAHDLRAQRAAIVALMIATGGAVVAIAASAADLNDRTFGVGLAVALCGTGFSLIAWAKSLHLDDQVVEEREPLDLSAADESALDDESRLTTATVGRRPLLVWLTGGALGALAVAVLSPILSLGRVRTTGDRRQTSWRPGRRLVTAEGAPVEAGRTHLDQLVTVFPEGHTADDDSQVVLIRVAPDLISADTIDAGAVDGWIAYSKICTHLGCSVGLFGIDTRPPREVRQLVCPCHQSVFDPLDRAKPVGGPAPRALPQLPLAIDADGYLIATSDFDRPVGPATWTEGR